MQIIALKNSLLYTIQLHTFLCANDFFIEVNNAWTKIFFPDFSLTFSKKSLIPLTFPDPLINFLTFPDFPDFPDRMETLL